MHITHLNLTNFRNYRHLELDLPPQVSVLHGGNAQGKSNFLEAIYLLATSRSHRATNERELIHWLASRDDIPVARVLALVERVRGNLKVEIALRGERSGAISQNPPETPPPPASPLYVQKRIRVNDIVRRASELVGQVQVVIFGSQDIEIIDGAPTLRRRYLDLTNSQVDPPYLRALQQYNRILGQRNHLLRLIHEQRAGEEELAFWDEGLVKEGSYLILQRQKTVTALADLAEAIHGELTGGGERLDMTYLPGVGTGEEDSESIAQRFGDALHTARGKEIAQGMTLAGPHRDDVRFLVNGADMSIYGSRGQQRTIALSLRLAEARFMVDRTGEQPIILLDDVLSELDLQRRRYLQESIVASQQVLITTTDLECFDRPFLAQATKFEVREGTIIEETQGR